MPRPAPPLLSNSRAHEQPQADQARQENKKKLIVTPNQILTIFSQLHRANAAGNELNSLDIFAKLAASHSRARLKNSKTFVKPEILTAFFSKIIKGDLPPKIAHIFRTTYLVALRKSEVDATRLRPLAYPQPYLRQIAAKVILHLFRGHFPNTYCPSTTHSV